MNPALEETIYPDFVTQNTLGVPTNADSTPVAQVYKNSISLALTLTVTNPATGLYTVAIPCTAATGFEAGKTYGLYVTATIAGVNTSGLIENWQMRTGSVDAVNVAKVNGTAQTASDLGAALVKIQASDYDTVTVSGDVLTLSNGATQTVTSSGRVTA